MKKAVLTPIIASALLLGSAHSAELRVVIPFCSAATEPFFKKIKAGYEKVRPDITGGADSISPRGDNWRWPP